MVLVTGATGLLGSHLCYHLIAEGKRVVAGFRTRENIERSREIFSFYNAAELFSELIWTEIELMDVFSLEQVLRDYPITEVYHCAGKVSYESNDVQQLYSVNVSGTANLVNACMGSGVVKFCFVSSIAAIGKEINNATISENTKWKNKNVTAYALSKNTAEREVWRAAEEGLNVVIVNPSVIIGPGCWNNSSSRILRAARNGLRFYTSGGTGIVDVRDVARCSILLMKQQKFSQRYILNSDNLSFKEIFTLASKTLGKNPPDIQISKWMFGIAYRMERIICVFTGKKPKLSKEFLKSGFGFQKYSNEKVKKELGYEFVSPAKSFEWACSFLPNKL